MKVALLSNGDPMSMGTWSGTPYHMAKALASVFPGLTLIRRPFPAIYSEVRHRIRGMTRNTVDINWLSAAADTAGLATLVRLRSERPDVVISVANTPIGSVVASRYPTIHVSDATFALMRDYYQYFRQQRGWVQRSGHAMEGRMIRQARACVYSSAWAATSAISDYGADPSRVHFVPFGCNLEGSVGPSDYTPRLGPEGRCTMVFIGVEWIRKGGDIALAATRAMRTAGQDAHLHVIGVRPPDERDDDAVTFHGFVDKQQADGQRLLDDLMRSGAFLLLPTRQDCTPMVLAEANAYGMPAITTRTGGVGSVVTDGVNGYCLDEAADCHAYATLIRDIWQDSARYVSLRQSSRRQFETTLNWSAWARRVAEIVKDGMVSAQGRNTGPDGFPEKID